jgi:glucose/arabinose dehydrogenase
MRKSWGATLSAMLVLAPLGFAGTPQDVGFSESVFAGGMSQITGLSWATDGSNTLFVSQKTGALRVIRNGALQSAAFATISVFTDSECGLDNVLVDPSYASNKFVYVFATVSNTTQQILRFTAAVDGSGNLVGQNRVQIGPNLPTRGVNHDGGGMAIGPDGLLYFGVGNNGNGNNVGGNGTSGEFTSLGSKIGRMDRFTGQPSTNNPYYSASDGVTDRDYIFARGMRNPFGLRFHPTTGALWLTEVGDGWEQAFIVPRDGNAGWPTENNMSTTNGLLIPKLAYQTNVSTFGGCLTRGAFYNASLFPSQYRGNLFFCDYNSGKVMRSVLDTSGNNINSTSVFVTGNSSLVDIAVGPDSALYYASNGGNIYRLTYVGTGSQNILPSATSLSVTEASSASFTVRLAIAPASNVTVAVSRSSGSSGVTATPTSLTFTPSTWNTPQTVTVSAAEDGNNVDEGATITCSASGLTSQNVVVIARDNDRPAGSPTATITQPRNGSTVSGTNADFYGDGSDPQGNGTLSRAEFSVDGVLKYTDPYNAAVGHFHYGGDHARWDTTSLTDGPHKVRMTVFDTGGLSGSHEVDIVVSNGGSGTGLTGEYFDNIDLTNLKVTRTDATVNFDWGSGSPDPSLGVDSFSVRWTGQVQANAGETVTFYTTTDDGVRLWVNNVLIIDHWVNQGPTEWSGAIALQAGQRYDLRMEYYENGGGATAQLSWSSPSTPKQIVPASRLFSLPAPWRNRDIGSVGMAGSTGISGGTFTVKGSGADIWGASDAFQFVYRPLAGDGTIVARVASVQNTDVWAKAGVMIRETLAADSRHAFMAITPGNGAAFQRRTAPAGASTGSSGPAVVAPYWVRLVRSGSTLTGSVSSDGSTWSTVGSDTIPMGALVDAGLAVTSHNNGALCTSTFTNVSVSGGAFQQDPGADGLLVMEAESFHGNVAQGGHTWDAVTPSGASGSARVANPNSGVNNDTGYTTNSPRLDYRVYFAKAGTHQVWVRGMGAGGSDDSCHVGLDGAATASSDRLSSFFTTWTWSRDTMDGVAATINVAAPGLHTINLWMREDGFVVDKILLTTNSGYVPTGTGPAQSLR